ncbi:MAG: hypothetical protein E3K32_04810 [wastewater metagenome]|nr:hypothetical protein [Candidatus Loosdrechtia aerotolerans]
MSSCNTKAKAIMVVLVGLFGLLCVGFGVSVTQKYRIQKERVHELEKQLGAGRKEVLKIPELMENLDKTEAAKKEIEEKVSEYESEKEDLAAQVSELQEEVGTFGAIKAAVGVQISGLQSTITEQQNTIASLEEEKDKLMQRISEIEEESKSIAGKSELQVADMKREQRELKKQIDYYTEAKNAADQELAEKQNALTELQEAKKALEQELARLKEQQGGGEEAPGQPQTPSSTPHFPLMEGTTSSAQTEDINKAFALLRERITSPTINLSEVSKLLSRIENNLKQIK